MTYACCEGTFWLYLAISLCLVCFAGCMSGKFTKLQLGKLNVLTISRCRLNAIQSSKSDIEWSTRVRISLHLLVIVAASKFIDVMSFRQHSCNTWYDHVDNYADVLVFLFVQV